MNSSFFIAGSLYLGWLLSPEALVLASNLAGKGGFFATFTLLFASAITILAIKLTKVSPQPPSPLKGKRLSISFNLAATITLVVFISTGMLVTAGFTFNETFLYWFPNFGFSAVLLSIILIIHLIGDRMVELSQKLFCSVTLLCLLIIIAAGLFTESSVVQLAISKVPRSQLSQTLGLSGGSLLLFLGAYQAQTRKLSPWHIVSLIGAGSLLLLSWQLVAMKHVPASKLADSTIPYIFIAREILGQTGRVLIGIAIISGTCAAVSSFFTMATQTCHSLLTTSFNCYPPKDNIIRRLLSFVFAGAIAVCMAGGLAGEAHLEMYIYGALLLWLLSVSVQMLMSSLQQGNTAQKIVTSMYFITFFYLTMAHDETSSLVMFIILALSPSLVLTSAVMLLGKKCYLQPAQ